MVIAGQRQCSGTLTLLATPTAGDRHSEYAGRGGRGEATENSGRELPSEWPQGRIREVWPLAPIPNLDGMDTILASLVDLALFTPRLNAEYKSLMAIEAEQKTLIDKLRNNEI